MKINTQFEIPTGWSTLLVCITSGLTLLSLGLIYLYFSPHERLVVYLMGLTPKTAWDYLIVFFFSPVAVILGSCLILGILVILALLVRGIFQLWSVVTGAVFVLVGIKTGKIYMEPDDRKEEF